MEVKVIMIGMNRIFIQSTVAVKVVSFHEMVMMAQLSQHFELRCVNQNLVALFGFFPRTPFGGGWTIEKASLAGSEILCFNWNLGVHVELGIRL